MASNSFYEQRKDVLKKIIAAWAKSNDELLAKPEESLKLIHEKAYSNIPYSDIQTSWCGREVRDLAELGQAVRGRDRRQVDRPGRAGVRGKSVRIGNWVDPKEFFDPKLYLEVVKKK